MEELPPDLINAATRGCRLSRIRWLTKAFHLELLLAERCKHVLSPDELSDRELIDLHQTMEAHRASALAASQGGAAVRSAT